MPLVAPVLLLVSAGMLLVPVLVLMLVPVLLLLMLLLLLAGCCCWRWNVSRHTWRQQQQEEGQGQCENTGQAGAHSIHLCNHGHKAHTAPLGSPSRSLPCPHPAAMLCATDSMPPASNMHTCRLALFP
jgi:hypothetical protein